MGDKYRLNTAAFHITYVCTHFCPMCYASETEDAVPPRMHPDVEQVKCVLKNLRDNGIENVSYVGGDPARYPHILETSQYAAELGFKQSILSNTLEFGDEATEIAGYIDFFEGTIHDTTAELHDSFCKRAGAYSLLLKNLKLFSDLGKKIGITINLTPFTYNSVYTIVDNVIKAEINVDYVVFQRIIPFGRATDSKKYELNLQQLDIALKDISKIEDRGIEIIFEDPFPMCVVDKKYQKYMHPCEWGLTKVSVDYQGNLSRCGADPRCTLGSLFAAPLTETWENSYELCEFRKKDFLPERCHLCPMLDQCGGACPISRSSSKFFSEDYMLLQRG